MARNNEQPPIRCSFCGKRETQAERLIPIPNLNPSLNPNPY